MRIFRKGVKRGMMKVMEKSFNSIVVLALLLQPVGTAGVYGAFSFSSGTAVAADEEPASMASEEPQEEVKVAEVKEETAKTEPEAKVEETEKASEEPKAVVTAPVEPVAGTVEDKEGSVEEAAPVVEDALPTVDNEEIAPVTEEPVVSKEEETAGTELIPQGVEEKDGQSEKVAEKTWQEDGKKATTSHPVVLNQKYVAPQNDEVTVTFTKLPEHPGTLSIEEVKLSDKQVAELGAFSHTAYDVTSSMEDGTFAYVLTLPIPKDKKDVQVKYAEGVEELGEAKTVASKNVDQKDDAVEVTLDHFTLFVATYGDVAFSVEKSSYVPGDTVYVKATGLNDTKFYKIFINPPVGSSFAIPNTSCFNPGDGVTTYSATYVLPADAAISSNWAAELKEYDVAGCTGPTTISDPFAVVAAPEIQHVPITICHATPPDTAANGYESIQVDDDSVTDSAHATQHSADIIPAFVVGDTNYPGKNWDATGQAIWNNECVVTGNLKAVKVVDDGSPLTAWSFQLDSNEPVAADANGVVDFGAVPVGQHTITEIGLASYSITGISGENCTTVPETAQAEAAVLSGVTTVCTFSNAVDKGSITIVKDALPDDPQDFSFTTTGTEMSSFTLDDDGSNGNDLSNTISFSSLFPGQYSFTENAVPGWELSGMNCVSSNVSLDMPVSATADITLAPGENVTCTYTNMKVDVAPSCGDGVVNQESEECDGAIEGGQYTCSESCQLVANPGILHVTKVVVNDDDGTGVVTDFSFSLNGGEEIPFEADGTNDVVVPAGSYSVTEPAVLGYQTSYSQGCEDIEVPAGGEASCIITNDDAPIEVVASKVICQDEADLPNYGLGGPDMTATTASDWVATHPNCHLERDWQFQWSYDGTANPGDNAGAAGGGDWHTFTSSTVVPLAGFKGDESRPVWLREVWNDHYIPFTYGNNPSQPNDDNVTAEFYCHKDVVNYDNWDWIDHPVAGGTYYCVAWNVGLPGKIIVKKQTDPAGSAQQFSFSSSFTEGNFALSDGQEYTSGDLTSGTYSVAELPTVGWKLENATCSDGSKPDAIDLSPGETVTCTFKNQETAHIVATKIVCDNESDLPNYGLGGPDFTATTAVDWVNTHEGCHFKKDWQFQWAYYSNSNPGDNTGESFNPDWHTFGPTGVNGETSTDVDLKSSSLLWVREVWDDNYIPFTYGSDPENPNSDDVSAEFYCHKDVVNYDNYDFIDASENAPSYYCVAWNVAKHGSITIVKDATPESDQDFTFTGDLGQFSLDDDGDNENELSNEKTFSDLTPGNYTVSEILPEGWQFAGAECVYDDESVGVNTENGKEIALGAGDDVVCTFHNEKNPVTVVASKIVCSDEADLPNYGEGGPNMTESTAGDWVETHESCHLEPNWQFQWSLDNVGNPGDNTGESADPNWHTFGPTGIDGSTTVNIPEPGTSRLWFREVLKEGYIPFTRDENGDNSNDVTAEFYCDTDVVNYDNWDWIDAVPNQTYYCVAWNVKKQEEENPQLQLRKFNDSVGDETPGNEVVYTLEVTAPDGPVDDVTVTDLPPEGFEYVAGSGEGAPFIHEYASPGIWNVGDLAAGETKVLTYKTKISGAQDAGLYKDLAFAKGVGGESTIFANSAANPFVGTEVNVVLDETPTVVLEEDNENKRVEKTHKKTQYVLGAATTLPMTGAPLGMIELALAGLVAGLGLIFVARRRTLVLPVLALLLVGGFALAPQSALAAELSVKIETPEAVTDTPNIKIGFVTLDVLGRSLTVECYKDSDVAPFASYALASAFGGNSGDCQVDGTVMPTDATYEFYVKAIASGEGNETVESNHVSVTLASATPGTPYHYDRNDASCQNVITFTTADDGGKTVKVELYRSSSTTFVADASTLVDEVAIGSNANGSFVEAAPGCSNDSYYALRAVAANGNGSGFVGDKDVNVDTHTVTKNKTKTVTLAGGTTSGAIPVSGGSGVSAGQVEGAATTAPETEEAAPTPGTESGSVLGEMTEASADQAGNFWDMIKSHPWRSLFWLIIIGVAGYFGYQSYRTKHDQSVQ